MMKRILMIIIVGMLSSGLSGCISGKPTPDTYVGKDGKVTLIESDRESCERSCNEDYSRCMETTGASDNNGINGPTGVFGASGECRDDLQHCLPGCKAQ